MSTPREVIVLTIDEAKGRIFDRLCTEFKKHGDQARVEWESLAKELEIPEEVFGKAMKQLTSDSGNLQVDLDIERKCIWLGTSGKQHCQEGTNPFKPQRIKIT